VKRENLHVTLRFLGDVDADGAKRAEDAAREAARATAPFGALFGPPGAFPTAKKARVLWLGLVEGVEPFTRMANALEAALTACGFEPEEREFTPHLTLPRASPAPIDRTPGRGTVAARLDQRPLHRERDRRGREHAGFRAGGLPRAGDGDAGRLAEEFDRHERRPQ
jgi:2'-5' RNA ligase